MTPSNLLARQSVRLQQIGVGLLLFTSFWGFGFPNLASVRLGLSVHTLSALLAVYCCPWDRLGDGLFCLQRQ